MHTRAYTHARVRVRLYVCICAYTCAYACTTHACTPLPAVRFNNEDLNIFHILRSELYNIEGRLFKRPFTFIFILNIK